MLECKCSICGKKFLRKKSQVLLGGGKFCSNKCRYTGRKNGKNVLCSVCGLEVYRQPREIKRSKSGKFFCSKNCLLKSIYETHQGQSNFKSGKHVEYRKKLIKKDAEENIACVLCGESDKILLVVHHIDKDRSNNSINNLLWLCHNCHFLVHHYKKEEKELDKKLHDKKM